MARGGSIHITQQPPDLDISNSFSLMGNEKFLHTWTFEELVCGCGGTYYTTLTDTRLLLRSEEVNRYNCCCKSSRTDKSIFLRDISEMRESRETRNCCSSLCTNCCRREQKSIEIRGTFGSEILHIPQTEMDNLQIEIPAAIGNHKLVSKNSIL
jgi:hypothetical protein